MPNFKDFAAYISKYGLARTNRFQVTIPLPNSVLSELDSKQTNASILNVTSNVVTTIQYFKGNGSYDAARGLDLVCTQTELPGKTINISETKYNGDVFKMGNAIQYGQQQFVFKVTSDFYEKIIMDLWMDKIIDPITHEIQYLEDYSVPITITQLDMQDRGVFSVIIDDAFPVFLNPMTLSNNEHNNTHELMVQFAYRRWLPLNTKQQNGITNLSQSPLGPYLSPVLSNPAVQRGLEVIKDKTGLDISGEAANIYNQVDNVVKSTTGTSIGKTSSLLNNIKATIATNGKISSNQQSEIISYVDNLLGNLN